MSSAFRSLGLFNYRLWFAGVTVSNIGTWMQRTAQDWVVLTDLTAHDATAVGVTMALQFGPQLLLTPLTGIVADAMDRRRLLLLTQSVMGASALALGILTITGTLQLWEMFLFALLLGIASAFDAPARQTMVGELVPQNYLANAVALNGTSFNVARLVGPAVAGVLTAVIGAGWVFLLNALTFLATIAAIRTLRAAELVPRTLASRRGGQIRAGFGYVRSRPDLMLTLAMAFLMGTFGMNFAIFVSTMAVAFGQSADGFGILSSVMAVGSVTGALLAARRERPRLRIVTVAAAGFGLALGAAALAPNEIVFGALLAIVGLCSVSMLNSANAYVQTTTPPELRGRVMALYMAILMGGTPIGAPLIGWVANTLGPRWGIGVGAAGALLAAGIAAVYWLRRGGPREARDARDARSLSRIPAAAPAPVAAPLADLDREIAHDRELATTELAVVETESRAAS